MSAGVPGNRLLLITHEFPPHRGGIAVYAAEMACAAARKGFDVEVWAPISTAPEPVWPFRLHRLRLAGTQSLACQWRMARRLFRHREALRGATLYLPEPGPILAMLLLQYFGIPRGAHLMLTLHGSEILRLYQRPFTRLTARRLFRRADRISVVSGHTRDLMRQCFPGNEGRTVLTPGGLRRTLTAEPLPPPQRTSRRKVVLTVARLHPRKGQLRVIEALAALPAEQRQEVEYWVAGAHGKENYDRAVEAAAARVDFPVRLLGDVPDDELPALYAAADIFAMTSMPHLGSVEGFGLVYLEAGACRLPVVAHAIGGVPEAVVDGVTGLLASPDEPAALTAAFARLLQDEALRRQMGENGRAHALRHRWEDAVETLFGTPPAKPQTSRR